MRPRFLPILLAFAVVSAAHLFGEFNDRNGLVNGSKMWLMPTLAAWFWFETRRFSGISTRNWVISGLVFSWLGDCLLIFSGEKSAIPFFLLGLGAFLIAHICYFLAFLKFSTNKYGPSKTNILVLLPFAIYLLAMDSYLWPSLPNELRLPVILYSLTICSMAVGATRLFGKMAARAARIVLVGALFFICSDSLLAVNKFAQPFPNAGFFIMLTYILGQFGIAFGVWRGLEKSSQ